MKRKITLTLMGLAFVSLMYGQVATKSNTMLHINKATNNCKIKSTKTVGDTLLYFDSHSWYINPTDEANFNYLNEDIDQYTPQNSTSGWGSDWNFWFTDSSAGTYFQEMAMPWDVDTAYYFAATSWFNPAGEADNWFSFGPITIPDSGATLKWYAKWNTYGIDGYMVKASETGMSNYSDFDDNSYFYKIDDGPLPNPAVDTLWAQYSADIPGQAAGSELYLAFHHTADDMDVLWLDEILIVEAKNVSIKEKELTTATLHQNFPNPVIKITSIPYDLNKRTNASIEIIDITGRLINTIELGNKAAGKYYINYDASGLSKGTYYYTLNTSESKITKKMVVVK